MRLIRMQRGGPQNSAAHSAHIHVDLGRFALGAVLVHMRGGMLHREPILRVVCNDLHLDGVHLNEIVVTAWSRVALAPALHLDPQALLHIHQHAPHHVPQTVRDMRHRLHDPRDCAIVAVDGGFTEPEARGQTGSCSTGWSQCEERARSAPWSRQLLLAQRQRWEVWQHRMLPLTYAWHASCCAPGCGAGQQWGPSLQAYLGLRRAFLPSSFPCFASSRPAGFRNTLRSNADS